MKLTENFIVSLPLLFGRICKPCGDRMYKNSLRQQFGSRCSSRKVSHEWLETNERSTEQTTETKPYSPKQSAAMTTNRMKSLRKLQHFRLHGALFLRSVVMREEGHIAPQAVWV